MYRANNLYCVLLPISLPKCLTQLNLLCLCSRTNTRLRQDRPEKNISELFHSIFFLVIFTIWFFNKSKHFHYFTLKTITHLNYLTPRNCLALSIFPWVILLCYVPGYQFPFSTALSLSQIVIGIPQNFVIICESYLDGGLCKLKSRK